MDQPLPRHSLDATALLTVSSQELESLLEKGVISEEAFDQVNTLLPAESPLSGAGARATPALPVRRENPAPPTNAMAALSVGSTSPAPPAYSQTGPPALPTRGPEAPPPSKPVLANARALYRYTASDERDLSFEKDDKVAVHEYMNADWWMGRNLRTGQEGIFPKTYVLVEENKEAGFNTAAVPQQQDPRMYPGNQYGNGYQPNGPPPQMNPYNANVPPMAVAEGPGSGSKTSEYGKKFGKKLVSQPWPCPCGVTFTNGLTIG